MPFMLPDFPSLDHVACGQSSLYFFSVLYIKKPRKIDVADDSQEAWENLI